MKAFNRISAIACIIITVFFVGTNIYIKNIDSVSGRIYRIDAERLETCIAENGIDNIDIKRYSSIKNVKKLNDNDKDFFEGGKYDYLIKKIGNEYYRFDYDYHDNTYRKKITITVNAVMGVLSVLIIMFLYYIKKHIIGPFEKLKNVPYELSKGNLTTPLKENKSRFFGRFMWGMDLLRQNIEQQKISELRLHKDKKTLILSLSHDIKTPLSAIKLYSKAISKNIYNDSQKNMDIADRINAKADEIESFVAQIIRASGEDFLDLTVCAEEFYMSDIIGKVSEYYREKLGLIKTDFILSEYTDCILKGDSERAVEVIQNIIENAIKYGDGQRIEIDYSDEENCRLIIISNSGCSLSESEMLHIFDSFWRGSNTGSKEGSGLGLYICRQLMNKMNGEIFAENKSGMMTVTLVFTKA